MLNENNSLWKALGEILSGPQLNAYWEIITQFQHGSSKVQNWGSIKSPDSERLLDLSGLKEPDKSRSKMQLSKLVIGKLNGGMGTSMGCLGPKSLVNVRDNKTFLDLILDQVDGLNREWDQKIPILLMNSFYTHEDTQTHLKGFEFSSEIISFQQNKFPRLHSENLVPLTFDEFENQAFYPPGHGDFYSCILQQGILQKLLDDGREFLFISNADNLGATVDLAILNFMDKLEVPFLMEMTAKTPADVKGGTLYQQDGVLKLLEIARVPEDKKDEFCDQSKFKVFNTNNIWINLAALKKTLDQGELNLAVLVNRKVVEKKPVIQLETAIGSALECFEGAVGLAVSRERFLPVKKTDDLLLVRSNLFNVSKGKLIRNSDRNFQKLPEVIFGDYLQDLKNFQKSFPTIPDMTDLLELKINGNVLFEGKSTLTGRVFLNGIEKPLIIPSGAIISDKTING